MIKRSKIKQDDIEIVAEKKDKEVKCHVCGKVINSKDIESCKNKNCPFK